MSTEKYEITCWEHVCNIIEIRNNLDKKEINITIQNNFNLRQYIHLSLETIQSLEIRLTEFLGESKCIKELRKIK